MMVSCHFSDIVSRMAAIMVVSLCPFVLDAQGQSMVGMLPSQSTVVEGFSFGAGFSSAIDEYLSPNRYRGLSFDIRKDRLSNRGDEKTFRYSRNRTSFSAGDLKNRTGNGLELGASGQLVHVWEASLIHFSNYDLLLGPSMGIGIDALYNPRNSNNPANVHGWISAGIGLESMFRFRLWHYPFALDASLSLPVAGVFFVPEYNMPYYILFEEKLYGKALHFMNPFNVTKLNHDVSLFIPVGRNQLSVSMTVDVLAHRLGGNVARFNHYICGVGYVHRFERKYNGR